MKTIELTKGQVAFVDDEDYDDLMRFSWHVAWEPKIKGYYAKRTFWLPNRKMGNEKMHRRIMGLKPGDGKIVDHLNHDALDNRRANLRVVTNRENLANARNQSPHGVGVHFEPKSSKRPYYVLVWFDGKYRYVGSFPTAEDGREARRAWLEAREA